MRGPKPKLTDAAMVRHLYLVEGKSQTEIGRMYGCYSSSVRLFMKKHGIPKRPIEPRKLPAPAEVNRLYWYKELTLRQIAAKFGCDKSTVQKMMMRHKIPRRRCTAYKAVSTCKVAGCGKDVCRVKRLDPKTRMHKWKYTSRCVEHHVKEKRRIGREWRRRRKNTPQSRWKRLKSVIQETAWVKA